MHALASKSALQHMARFASGSRGAWDEIEHKV